nr:myosin-binding protein 2 [Ipomoea batatas]
MLHPPQKIEEITGPSFRTANLQASIPNFADKLGFASCNLVSQNLCAEILNLPYGSVIGDLDGLDPVSTIEQLKTALKSERKALHAVYTELEEERSASAVAANQTMAMINRLQEEKAAMQMEALQHQRMMDEQPKYDQEVLQLLNELLVKREKERQELEKELEVYKKRVLEFEAKEKDSDALSIDLNQEAKEDEGFYAHQESTPADETNGKHQILSSMGKSLLPLFDDAISDENGDVAHENGFFYSNGVHHDLDITGDYDLQNNKSVALEEELDCLHERLQALEADREFLNYCIKLKIARIFGFIFLRKIMG